MAHLDFTASANNHPQRPGWNAFLKRESTVRQQLIQNLDRALNTRVAGSNSVNFNYAANLHRLKQLRNALTATGPGQERIFFDYEQTLPVAAQHERALFREALLRLEDKTGQTIAPYELLKAVDNAAFGTELGSLFRLWLAHAQIADFYGTRTPHAKLSLNIDPGDVDHKIFRDTLTQGLLLVHKAGFHNIILEAVESASWTSVRQLFLENLAYNGLTIAIDDYGAPNGHNQLSMLKQCTYGKAGAKLVVKLDGALIRNFLDKNDTTLIERLREVKAHAPQATVVAEWVTSAADANNLLTRLSSYDLRNAIHLVQGRDLTDTPQDFVKKIAAASGSPGGPAPKK